jgi:hypothetical protein
LWVARRFVQAGEAARQKTQAFVGVFFGNSQDWTQI